MPPSLHVRLMMLLLPGKCHCVSLHSPAPDNPKQNLWLSPWGPTGSLFSGVLQLTTVKSLRGVCLHLPQKRVNAWKQSSLLPSTEPLLHKPWIGEWILISYCVDHLIGRCHKINGRGLWTIGIKNWVGVSTSIPNNVRTFSFGWYRYWFFKYEEWFNVCGHSQSKKWHWDTTVPSHFSYYWSHSLSSSSSYKSEDQYIENMIDLFS